MKADLTRNSFDPLKHFSRVVMQQGRVQLDADWNEQAAILLHQIRALAAYALPSGGGDGFTIAPLDYKPLVTDDFALGPGSFWVGGILCELASTPVAVASINVAQKQVIVAAWTVDGIEFSKGRYVALTATRRRPRRRRRRRSGGNRGDRLSEHNADARHGLQQAQEREEPAACSGW